MTSFTVVGTSAPRRDAIDKVTGRAKFAGDIAPPGVLHARILRPPAHGATLSTVDTSAAERRPGVRVVRDGDLIAALHEHRDEADKALALIKAEFSRPTSPLDDTTIFEHLLTAAPEAQTVAEGGTLEDGERLTTRTFEQTYLNSYVAHAAMEPHAAVAAFENGKLTVWASTQTPFPLKSQLVQALNLPDASVRVGARRCVRLLELGGGDASSTVVSPKIFDRFVAPFDTPTVEAAHDAGQRIVYHTCGGMMPLLERIADMAPDAMETFTPKEMGGDARLAEAKARIGTRVCMIGGFDQFHYFTRCTPEETRRAVRAAFEQAGAGGGFILAPSDHFFEADDALLRAFGDEARRCCYGGRPPAASEE